MKVKYIIELQIILVAILLGSCVNGQNQGLLENVGQLNDVRVTNAPIEMYFTQPIDHNIPEGEKFEQRVILNHISYDKPVVVILEGYSIYSDKRGELSNLLDANQITIEHRFFKNSKPDTIPWDKLNIWQAATDQHKIIQEFKKIYKGKFITTGISKGGQTTMYHRYFYPEDVDISVPYVAPLNFAREDKRIHDHLNSVGDESTRTKIKKFQLACFKNFDRIIPLLKSFALEKNQSYEMGFKRALELTILEYPFAYWQWGYGQESDIPSEDDSVKDLFSHLVYISGPSFFDKEGIKDILPFYYQALTQIGMYSYEIEPFKEYLTDENDVWFEHVVLPEWNMQFDDSSMIKVNEWIQTKADNMLFIYGEYDTWTATAVELNGNENCKVFINPEGSHRTRINSFPEKSKNEILETLNKWISEK